MDNRARYIMFRDFGHPPEIAAAAAGIGAEEARDIEDFRRKRAAVQSRDEDGREWR